MFATSKINLRLSITVLIACTFELSLQAQHADQIFYNGKILIVDSDFSVAEAVAVKSGRISAVGSVAELSSRVGPKHSAICGVVLVVRDAHGVKGP